MNNENENEYRKKPSDLPYRATRWMDVWARLWALAKAHDGYIFIVLVSSVVLSLFYATQVNGVRQSQCAIDCHPVIGRVVASECWCMPPSGRAFRNSK